MNLFTAAFSKIFKSGNQQVLDKIKPLIVEINNRESSLSSSNDHVDQLVNKLDERNHIVLIQHSLLKKIYFKRIFAT